MKFAALAGLTVLANLAYRSLQDWVLIQLALGVPHLAVMLRDSAFAMRKYGKRRELMRMLLWIERRCKRDHSRRKHYVRAAVEGRVRLGQRIPASFGFCA